MTKRILVRKNLARERFADDPDLRTAVLIAIGEVPAAYQPNAHGREIDWTGQAKPGVWQLAIIALERLPAFDRKVTVRTVLAAGQSHCARG